MCSTSTSARGGGTLDRVDLLAYPKVKGEATPVRLENHDDPQSLYELQSGLIGPAGAEYPTHRALYSSAQADYTLDSAGELRVPLTWSEGGRHGHQDLRVPPRRLPASISTTRSHNGGSVAWQARPYAQILRNDPPTKRSYFNVTSYAFHGPAIWDGTKYRKLDIADAQDSHLSLDVRDGWVAALQHHFVSAIVPPRGAPWPLRPRGVRDGSTCSRPAGPEQTVAPGASAQFRRRCSSDRSCSRSSRPPRPQLEPRRRLRQPVDPRAAAVPRAQLRTQAHRQLGRRDHPRDVPAEAAVLSAVGGERPLDGEDEDACSRASRTCRKPTRTTARSSAAR